MRYKSLLSTNSMREGNRVAAERHAISMCKLCGTKITWWDSNELGKKSRPKNLDMTPHTCKQYQELYKKRFKK